MRYRKASHDLSYLRWCPPATLGAPGLLSRPKVGIKMANGQSDSRGAVATGQPASLFADSFHNVF
jgi:hypothetical protein